MGRGARRFLRGALPLLLATPPAQAADVEGSSHVTLFQEPSTTSNLSVIHPQGDVSASFDGVGLSAGYELDIVSGATPKVFGPSEGPDAVSGATRFSDTRQAARGGLSFETAAMTLSTSYGYGWESDYRSHTLTVAARGDFLERNFTLGLAYTRNFDSVCDQNNATIGSPLEATPLTSSEGCFRSDQTALVTRSLAIHTFEPALSWTATPTLLLQLGGTLQILDGFQSNPYRAVQVGSQGRRPQERLPTYRQRGAVFLRAHKGLPLIRGALRLSGRAYRDTWDVMAGTADAEYLQYLGSALILGVRGRYHTQTGAVFYRGGGDYRIIGPRGRYWTGDRELSPLGNLMLGGRVSFLRRRQQEVRALLEELELTVRFDLIRYQLDADAPNRDRPIAFVTQAGLSLRF